MVRLITIEREYGSGGAEFGHRLADYLGWRVIDKCLVDDVATKVGISPRLAEECDEQLDPWHHRLVKAFWAGSMERMPGNAANRSIFDGERMSGLQRESVLAAAAEGNCVIVGRGAASILSTFPGAFHIFISAGHRRKIDWFRKSFPAKAGLPDSEIAAQIAETDKRRAAYIRRFYGQDWGDRRLYHLMMDSCMGEQAMLGAVMSAAALQRPVSV